MNLELKFYRFYCKISVIRLSEETMEKTLFDLDIKNIWIEDDESEELINERFAILNKEMEIIYQFVLKYYEYLYVKRDYGTGMEFTMLEIHALTDIIDNPGITVTEIANKWRRTTSAISQIVKMFHEEKLVRRVRNRQDGKINNLYATDKGKELVRLHKHYDNVDVVKTTRSMLKQVTMEELESFYKVAEIYGNIIENSTKYNGVKSKEYSAE